MAEVIRDLCHEVTPLNLHDVKRHEQGWDPIVDWDEFFFGETDDM